MLIKGLLEKCEYHMRTLCDTIGERPVGSGGNRRATRYCKEELESLGWKTESHEFDAIDWKENGAFLRAGNSDFEVFVSPYSRGCDVTAVLADARNIGELEGKNFTGSILFLHGELAKEQLMPKNFVFFNPEEHQRIIKLLEESGAQAIICGTGRNAGLAGGVYPFPLIEDGDFDIPSVYMTEEEGARLESFVGEQVTLRSLSERIPGKGYNVLGKNSQSSPDSCSTAAAAGPERVVVTAHIDAKKNTPGAIDNGTGVTILLLLAELLKDYSGSRRLELAAFNGEDYFSVPGQMDYIKRNQGRFDEILVNINIDGAGYKESRSALSFYGLPLYMEEAAKQVIKKYPDFVEGPQWPQGDHSIFIQQGRPAIAASSEWFIENIDTQEITHTPKDNLEIVDYRAVAGLAQGLYDLIVRL